MGMRLGSAHGLGAHTWRLLISALAVTLLVTLGATSVSAANAATCSVTNSDTGRSFPRLQDAVDAAKPGARLVVKGMCRGTTVIDKGVVIEGVRTTTRPLLAGGHEGIVLTVRRGVAAAVQDLAIEGGRGHFREGGPEKPYNWPEGVLNHGNLILRSVIVKENRGIGIENTGRLRLKGRTLDRENGFESVNEYTGIHNTGTLRLNGTASRSPDFVVNDGILVMNGASWIRYLRNSGSANLKNASRTTKVLNRGTLTLGDQSRIAGLSGTSFLVGVDNFGTLILNDASGIVRGYVGVQNRPGSKTVMNGSSVIRDHDGGGVRNSGTLVLNGSSSIRENRIVVLPCGSYCLHDPLRGAGVFNTGVVVLNDSSSITGNKVEAFGYGSHGGGVYMVRDPSLPEPPSLTMTGSATISGNSAGDQGGGVYVGLGSVLDGVMCGSQTGGNVYGNTPDDCYVEP
jgi:hypothetical protein